MHAVAEDLRARRDELVASARARGTEVAALATSPVPVVPTPTPDERYARMQDRFGKIARDQLICGAHVHVSVASRAEGVAAIDGVRRWNAVLLALTGNSPFWDGADTGYASYRTISWGRWPSAGPSPWFGSEAAYDAAVHHLVATGAAMDPGMLYFDARLSASYPTVEFRVADVGQEVEDEVLLAGLCRALVETAVSVPDPEPVAVLALRAAAWRAARFGLGNELVDPVEGCLRPAGEVVDRLLAHLTPALRRTGDLEHVTALLDRLVRRGTGAELQRADYARGGAGAVVAGAVGRTAATATLGA